MNKVFLLGRLTREPELRYTGSNIPVASFSIAVNRSFTNQAGEKEADFINVIVWKKRAETCKNYLTKGSQVAIEGRIQTRNYDGQDGKKVYVTEVVADNVEFLSNNSHKQEEPQEEVEVESSDPFADFGSQIEIDYVDDEGLPF